MATNHTLEETLSITAERRRELVVRFGEGEADTGSAAVQIAIFSERIRNLSPSICGCINRTSRRGAVC